MKKHAGVDAYIAKAAPFARPILEKIRAAFHRGCPEVEETIKWGFPHFVHRGILGSMAAFKAHATFGFWRGAELPDPRKIFTRVGKTLMNAARITDAAELPPAEVLVEYVRAAVRLNEAARTCAKPRLQPRKAPATPKDLLEALKKSPKALATFESFPPSHKREYVEWVVEAKKEETRAKRIAQAVAWMSEGKSRNWKYERC